MIRRPPRSTPKPSSAASDVYKRQVLSKVKKNLGNHYCEMTKFDDKIIIRCLADDNYDLKKTLNIIMKNVINDKLPKSWDL